MKEKSKDKILVERRLFYEINYKRPFTWGDIKHLALEDSDIISAGHQEAHYGSDSSYDAHYNMLITRQEIETDQEYKIRQERIEQDNKWAKERRLESYLKLHEEFKEYVFKQKTDK